MGAGGGVRERGKSTAALVCLGLLMNANTMRTAPLEAETVAADYR